MDLQEVERMRAEIEQIRHELDESHIKDGGYMPHYIQELRNYVFQIHATYEQSMQLIITIYYLKRLTRKTYESQLLLLEQITFEGKIRLVAPVTESFPLKAAKQLNHIRNEFAHTKGSILTQKYGGERARLKLLRHLKKTNKQLNAFWKLPLP